MMRSCSPRDQRSTHQRAPVRANSSEWSKPRTRSERVFQKIAVALVLVAAAATVLLILAFFIFSVRVFFTSVS